jgi:glutamate N-acetyltransferase/amino-acid N-acetyltransferase
VEAGIRRERKDLALLRSLPRATGAAMWTQNRVQAAPVVVSKAHLEVAQPQAVVVNSGVANAATGDAGLAAAKATAEHVAATLGLAAEEVIVLSTGVIGAPLPLDRVLA